MSDVAALEASLGETLDQLAEVEALREAADVNSDDHTALEQLRADLLQLIQLSEAHLLDAKKQQLLAMLDGDGEDPAEAVATPATGLASHTAAAATTAVATVAATAAAAPESRRRLHRLAEGETVSSSCLCQAPFAIDGVTQYYNAMVLSVDHEKATCCVLFMHPLSEDMQSLDGLEVSTGMLQPYVEPDYSKLRIHGPCLSKDADGVWRPAMVLRQDSDDTLSLQLAHSREYVSCDNAFCWLRLLATTGKGSPRLRGSEPFTLCTCVCMQPYFHSGPI
jgi:hypothetical protein